MSVLEEIRAAKRPERAVPLCLRGDLNREYEELQASLTAARDRDAQTLAGGDAKSVAERMDALALRMRAAIVVFRLRALDKMRPVSLLGEHPPRDDDDLDNRFGYNRDTYYQALIRESTYELMQGDDVQPASELTDDDWTGIWDALGHGQFDRLTDAAMKLNNGDVDIPTSALASLLSQASGESSRTRKPGESRRNGGGAGNRRGSRKSSETAKAKLSA